MYPRGEHDDTGKRHGQKKFDLMMQPTAIVQDSDQQKQGSGRQDSENQCPSRLLKSVRLPCGL